MIGHQGKTIECFMAIAKTYKTKKMLSDQVLCRIRPTDLMGKLKSMCDAFHCFRSDKD
jgi:hypothetical protein